MSIMKGNNGKSNSSPTVMSSRKHRGKSYSPYAFTEHGVAMLASVLKSAKARKMSIAAVRAFIALRKSVTTVQRHPGAAWRVKNTYRRT